MNHLLQGPASHPGKKNVIQLLDHFHHEGSNGIHSCLVLELLGSSVFSETESYTSNRLPGEISWEASKQIVQGLEYIHARGITHGGQLNFNYMFLRILLNLTLSDLHPGNVVFASTTIQNLSDMGLITSIRKPRTGDVMAIHRASLTPRVPRYLVCPTSVPSSARDVGEALVKIVDFGEASLQGQQSKIHCPLVFQAPETIFASRKDLQTDVWSLACTVCASKPASSLVGLTAGTGV